MAWSVTEKTPGRWHWEIFLSAYGMCTGEAGTFAEALVQLAVAQGDLLEAPMPSEQAKKMLSDPAGYVASTLDLARYIGQNIFPLDEEHLRSQLTSR